MVSLYYSQEEFEAAKAKVQAYHRQCELNRRLPAPGELSEVEKIWVSSGVSLLKGLEKQVKLEVSSLLNLVVTDTYGFSVLREFDMRWPHSEGKSELFPYAEGGFDLIFLESEFDLLSKTEELSIFLRNSRGLYLSEDRSEARWQWRLSNSWEGGASYFSAPCSYANGEIYISDIVRGLEIIE